MRYKTIILAFLAAFGLMSGCDTPKSIHTQKRTKNMRTIYLAGGCFWGTEHLMQMIPGVLATKVGFANSIIKNPSYKQVCTGTTRAAETVEVEYDEKKTALSFLLEIFYKSIEPTSLNRQGNDVGTQYRTGIYYTDSTDIPIINHSLAELQKKHKEPIAIETKALENFYPAETYHQDYLNKNPNGYCHIPFAIFAEAQGAECPPEYIQADAALRASYKPSNKTIAQSEQLKKELTPMQYHVAIENGTEPPFENKYWNNREEGIYVDIVSGEPLFSSLDKFDSKCGWPSFSKPINDSLILEKEDRSHGMVREEVRSANSNIHLGHVFDDGPLNLGGKRYCINSASLRFIPRKDLKKEGYEQYERLFEKNSKQQ